MTGHESVPVEPEGLQAARRSMEKGIELVAAGDYRGYDQHCVVAKSDDRDATQLYMLLRGPLWGRLIAIGNSDATDLYDAPEPTWAADGFIEFERAG